MSTQPVTTHCKTPAKLIISGEHSVVFGAPALCMAIDQYTHTTIEYAPSQDSNIHIVLEDFDQEKSFSTEKWTKRAIEIETNYKGFLEKHLSIEMVICNPFDLIISCLFHFNQRHLIKHGSWRISITSHQLIGKGLGSSASVIVGMLHSLFLHHIHTVDNERLLVMARHIESRQHGKSSGLDPSCVFLGGVIEFSKQQIKPLTMPTLTGWLIDSGPPLNHTGQVVSAVEQWASQNSAESRADLHPIWKFFSKTTLALKNTWKTQDHANFLKMIQENQQLLETIGIVPTEVQQMIASINKTEESACKVCGAGSIEGNQAGMLLLLGKSSPENLDIHLPTYPFHLDVKGSQCKIVNL